METKELLGKEILGFKFTGWPDFTDSMEKFVGKPGTITHVGENYCTVKFEGRGSWSYPYPHAIEYLVEPDRSIEEIIAEVKQLNSQL